MGTVIVCASSKGGVGKSTAVTALAVNLAAFGYRVAICDADPNQAVAIWHRTAEAPPLTCSSEIDHNTIVGHLMKLAEDHDVVLADTAGFANQTAMFAMGAADLVLIPVMPDRNSVLEARKTAKQVESVGQIARRPIPLMILRNRWNPKGLSEKAALEDIEASKLPMLQSHLSDLVAYQKATFSGVMPRSGQVGMQVDRLIEELRGIDAIPPKSAYADEGVEA